MFGWFGKQQLKPEESQVSPGDAASPAQANGPPAGDGSSAQIESPAEQSTSVPGMLEILKLLERIEYGLDEQEIADALAMSADDVLANCAALEDEMFIHHHEDLAKWFIGQRGLAFLRLHGNTE